MVSGVRGGGCVGPVWEMVEFGIFSALESVCGTEEEPSLFLLLLCPEPGPCESNDRCAKGRQAEWSTGRMVDRRIRDRARGEGRGDPAPRDTISRYRRVQAQVRFLHELPMLDDDRRSTIVVEHTGEGEPKEGCCLFPLGVRTSTVGPKREQRRRQLSRVNVLEPHDLV